MFVYAGIDEAGYGPMFGPLLVGRTVLAVPHLPSDPPPDAIKDWHGTKLWTRLNKAVCRDLGKRRGRIAVNDSKKLHGAGKNAARTERAKLTANVSITEDGAEPSEALEPEAAVELQLASEPAIATVTAEHTPAFDGKSYVLSHKPIEHLERAALAFAAVSGRQATSLCDWLDRLGETCHHNLAHLPWYDCTPDRPWNTLPCACTEGEIAVARSLLASTTKKVGVEVLDLGAAVVFEDRFNKMVAATRSKAAASFTFVAQHLRVVWDKFGQHHPQVVVDRQSGRMRYRELLAMCFPEAALQILDETPDCSAYRLTQPATSGGGGDAHPARGMTIRFEVDSECRHMPVALASMISKYTRELLMSRFQAWFLCHAPTVRPTAGYAADAKRFWEEIQPHLAALAIDPHRLARSC
jgi:hypothetical protein